MITFAQWDSDNFGIKVGNAVLKDSYVGHSTLDQIVAKAHDQKYDLVYAKDCYIEPELLCDKVILADEKVIYCQTIFDPSRFKIDENVISVIHRPLNDNLLRLSVRSGMFSRYKVDPNLPDGVFETLYRLWIEKSLSGALASDVLAYCIDDVEKGMLTFKNNGNTTEIGLVAVDADCSGCGVGSRLMNTFLSKCNAGAKVEVATQRRNHGACHFYEKNGFVVQRIINIYHIWLK